MKNRLMTAFILAWTLPCVLYINMGYCLKPFQMETGYARNTLKIPYKKMLNDPLTFTGHSDNKPALSQNDPIPIGLFVPDHPGNPAGQAILKGANLAIALANQKGGYQGRPFRMINRWADAPWSAGSKEIINFVYQDDVVALISYMSTSSHIAEQIALKSYLPVITPVSSDTSLTHARVPWIFRLPPNDQMQAKALVRSCVTKSSVRNIGLVTGTDQDSRMAAQELEKAMIRQGIPPLYHHEVKETLSDFTSLNHLIEKVLADALIIRLKQNQMTAFIKSLHISGINCPLFVPWIPGFDVATVSSIYKSEITTVVPFSPEAESNKYTDFSNAYIKMYHELPLPSAAYGFDALEILIKAVHSKGPTRVAIRDELAGLSGYIGVTGKLIWDTGGGNISPSFIKVFQ